ncbi:hypothetical protein PVA45_05940 [Entomospira entomophila]|uniref:Lipoprotein n=1 Tax=Entomospira entomophila TaxID=2719988 RepID=A0A968KRT1_9SPIO|nr:hypothetical protein [Entomospira entomophilus]NIZ41039.1 hypothetical protein [Entomospira entomophilus]WDI35250.1 hypothetical protein PVA45_05940 [Entomospira entomophilus]
MRKVILILIALLVISCKYDKDQGNVALEEIFEELDTSLFSIENVVFQFMNNEYLEYGFFSFDLIYNGEDKLYFYIEEQVIYENNTIYYGLVDWQHYMQGLWDRFSKYGNDDVHYKVFNMLAPIEKKSRDNYRIQYITDPEEKRKLENTTYRNILLLDYNEIMAMNEIVIVLHVIREKKALEIRSRSKNYVVTTAENPGQRIELRSTDIQIIDKRTGALKQNS